MAARLLGLLCLVLPAAGADLQAVLPVLCCADPALALLWALRLVACAAICCKPSFAACDDYMNTGITLCLLARCDYLLALLCRHRTFFIIVIKAGVTTAALVCFTICTPVSSVSCF